MFITFLAIKRSCTLVLTRSSAAQIFGSFISYSKNSFVIIFPFTHLGAVSHEFGEEDCLLHFVPHLDLEGSDGLGPGG